MHIKKDIIVNDYVLIKFTVNPHVFGECFLQKFKFKILKYYLVTISTGTLNIFATFNIVSICLPVAAAK